MNSFFEFSSAALARPLLFAAIASVVLLALLALRGPHLARIGLRSAGRRRTRAALIIAGLMLSTMFVAAALAVDDTITQAVKTVAVFNLGRIDEDVTGGFGALGLYDAEVGGDVTHALAQMPHVAGVAPALSVPNVLIADETARQVRGGVTGLGMAADAAGPLGELRTTSHVATTVNNLADGNVFLNTSTAQLLGAQPGDTVALYSTLWPGQRYRFRVQAIVTGGPLGDQPAMILSLPTLQALAGARGSINHIYVANAGDGLTGVGYSEEIEDHIYSVLPANLRVDKLKLDGTRFAVQAQDIFGRILGLFTLFALSIGLLLIFLIFVLLATERRSELGMMRALGMRRAHIVRMLLFEGAAYDIFAAAIGILAGLGLGVLVVVLVSPIIQRIGFPLKVTVQPESVVVAFCLGLLVTLVTIWGAAWSVSRMTVTAALRDLPDPPPAQPTLLALTRRAVTATLWLPRTPHKTLGAWGTLGWAMIARGLVPLVLGWALATRGIADGDTLLFSIGLSFAVAGGVLVLRWLLLAAIGTGLRLAHAPDAVRTLERVTLLANRLAALLIGVALALYWSLPFDALEQFGLPRFSGGIQVFFIAGVMMVFGTVWGLAPNLDLLLLPLGWLLTRLGRLRHVIRIALVYPAHQRFRTGIGLSLFSLVCFTMVVMACIAASATQSYDNLPAQTADYDIAGQPLFTPVGGIKKVTAALARADNGASSDLAAVSSATPLPLGILQPGVTNARWRAYPVSEVQGAFLDGVGLPLVAHAPGYASDTSVWQAVRTHPGDVVIDAGALSQQDADALGVKLPPEVTAQQFIGPPIAAGLPGLSSLEGQNTPNANDVQAGLLGQFVAAVQDPEVFPQVVLHLEHVVTGAGRVAPTPLWVADLRGGQATKLTVIGIVDNARGQRYGLFGSAATFAPTESGQPSFGNEYYYFKTKPGVDAHTGARQIGSALLNYGFETTVMQDVLLDVNGPRVFMSRVLVGLVGLTLLVGMAALAVTGSRAVVERRQQIGMLRALGFRRWHVQLIFLIESLLVGAAGTAIGLTLGLILCRNVFAVDFFSAIQSGLGLVVPWQELGIICLASLLASLVASALPAWQAGHVAPADALRYE